MISLGDLPIWAVVLLCLAIAVVLALQNVSWLLWVRAMLNRQQRGGASARDDSASESKERTDSRRRGVASEGE